MIVTPTRATRGERERETNDENDDESERIPNDAETLDDDRTKSNQIQSSLAEDPKRSHSSDV